MTLASGTRLGPYEIVAPIGAGGMGEVYRAKDGRLGREAAIKVLPEALASDAERLRRFEQEARSASALNHPNIVTIYDVGRTDGVSWIAMELVEGTSLRALVASGALPAKKVLSIGAQIAEGLARAHAAGIVHRDLKPENVMVTPDGLVKILDFGLAKPTAPSGEAVSQLATATQQTEAGIVVGTVGYMSPEQATGKTVDYRSDQFALGAILYEMATGKRAFQRATAIETLSAILKEEPAPLSSVAPDAPEPFERVVRRCLAKEPEGRYHSTRDLARDLAELGASGASPTAARPELRPGRARARRWIGAVAAAAAILLGTWFVASRSRRARSGDGPGEAPSIAVLPFQNVGGRPEDEYFSDGMTDSLITEVARIKNLLVIARNSAFRYKGASPDARKVGEELGVRYVLEGSVQRSGDSVRVNAQLIDATTGYSIWAEKYDRPMKEVFALQDDISKNVVAALKLAFQPGGKVFEGPPTPTPNLEAYDAYLQGLFYANAFQWTEKDKALPFFERAVTLDSSFAVARAALARHYVRKAFESDPERIWEQRALAEIQKALSLDPTLAEAYLARGQLTWTLVNHFPHEKAARDFRRAVELAPSLAAAHGALASLYAHTGFLDEALVEYRLALKIDPRDMDSLYRIPRVHLYQQKYAEALAGFDATPDFRSDFQKPLVLAHLGRLDEAVALARGDLTNPTHLMENFDRASTRAVVFALSGDRRAAEENLATAEAGAARGSSHYHHVAYNVACAYAIQKRKAEALAWLRRTADEGMPCYPLFEKDPFLDGLRRDPGFEAFLGAQKAEHERLRAALGVAM